MTTHLRSCWFPCPILLILLAGQLGGGRRPAKASSVFESTKCRLHVEVGRALGTKHAQVFGCWDSLWHVSGYLEIGRHVVLLRGYHIVGRECVQILLRSCTVAGDQPCHRSLNAWVTALSAAVLKGRSSLPGPAFPRTPLREDRPQEGLIGSTGKVGGLAYSTFIRNLPFTVESSPKLKIHNRARAWILASAHLLVISQGVIVTSRFLVTAPGIAASLHLHFQS